MSLLGKKKRYLEDHDLDEVYFKNAQQVAEQEKRKQLEKEAKIEAERKKILESDGEETSDDDWNKVDLYPSQSKKQRMRNAGKTEKQEEFFINKPDYMGSFEEKYSKAREFGLTEKPLNLQRKGFYNKIKIENGGKRKTKRSKRKKTKRRKRRQTKKRN